MGGVFADDGGLGVGYDIDRLDEGTGGKVLGEKDNSFKGGDGGGVAIDMHFEDGTSNQTDAVGGLDGVARVGVDQFGNPIPGGARDLEDTYLSGASGVVAAHLLDDQFAGTAKGNHAAFKENDGSLGIGAGPHPGAGGERVAISADDPNVGIRAEQSDGSGFESKYGVGHGGAGGGGGLAEDEEECSGGDDHRDGADEYGPCGPSEVH